ncbi:MAG TPA: hypothetical protein V6C97_18720 [Oculatellaceae cyanobacterium]
MLRFIIACLISALFPSVFEPAFCSDSSDDLHTPELVRYHHINAPDFSFLEGQWQTPDKKFTENWSRTATGRLIGLRTLIGDDNREESYLFGFKGEKAYLLRLNSRLEDWSTPEEISQGSCQKSNEFKGTISFFSMEGLRLINNYECPNKNELNIEIETDQNSQSTKKTVHLVRVR